MCRIEKFYKYGNFENMIKSLNDKYLWASYPENFDDPYDVRIKLDYSGVIPGKPIDEQEKEARRVNKIICFSAKYDNPVLWYHYADGYKGVVLGFNNASPSASSESKIKLDTSNFSDKSSKLYRVVKDAYPLSKVEYSNDRPKPYSPISNNSKDLKKAFKKKSLSWKFEEEYRMIIPNSLCNEQKIFFKEEALSEVIVGINVDDTLIDIIKTILRSKYKTEIKLYKICERDKDYGFDKIELKYWFIKQKK